jgi:hypothetical protein
MLTLQADSLFDDSFAVKMCGSTTIPENRVIMLLCMEMMELGKWYTKELETIGLYEPGVEVKIEPDNPRYREVRDIGVEVDLVAQELMVMMAREECNDHKADDEECDYEIIKSENGAHNIYISTS